MRNIFHTIPDMQKEIGQLGKRKVFHGEYVMCPFFLCWGEGTEKFYLFTVRKPCQKTDNDYYSTERTNFS